MDQLRTKTNRLLVKDDVGKSKPCTFNLPNKDFAFGKTEPFRQEGVDKITTSWQVSNKSTIPDANIPVNFIKVNKFGTKNPAENRLNVSKNIFTTR